MAPFKLGIIGLGNMGGAALHGLIDKGILEPQEIVVADHDDRRRQEAVDLGCVAADSAAQMASAEQIMLAVKPQSFAEVADWLGEIEKPTVAISVMAGLRSEKITTALGSPVRVVRVMPNTPCRIGHGMTTVALGCGAQQSDAILAVKIFDALGHTVQVDEAHLDAATALGGSGPAYVFLLAEAMMRSGDEMGLQSEVTQQIVENTIAGAGQLLLNSEHDAHILREMVTSKGGTTAAAIELMLREGLPQVVIDAVLAAQERGKELGAQ